MCDSIIDLSHYSLSEQDATLDDMVKIVRGASPEVGYGE